MHPLRRCIQSKAQRSCARKYSLVRGLPVIVVRHRPLRAAECTQPASVFDFEVTDIISLGFPIVIHKVEEGREHAIAVDQSGEVVCEADGLREYKSWQESLSK